MIHWLKIDPEEILDDVIYARQLTGEDIDESSQPIRKMVRTDIVWAQADIANSIQQNEDGVAIFRSIWLDPEAFEKLEARGLGECWAFDSRGAHSYYGSRQGVEIVVEARVNPDDIVWPTVIGMWSSGEAEARIDTRAQVLIEKIRTKGGDPVREDLWGTEMNVGAAPTAKATP
jgi:hypothetical protein